MTLSPRETDTKLAELYLDLYKAEDRVANIETDLKRQAGAKFYYRRRQRVTDMRTDEALGIVEAELRKLTEHRAAHEGEDGLWVGYAGIVLPYAEDQVRRAVTKYHEQQDTITALEVEIGRLEATYTGWSRFFLVTSSPGHVHSSMYCSTCYPSTRYGWLPEMSGQSEAEAVAEFGPTLCTVCFPSAPVTWTEGKKLTAAEAKRRAYH